MRLLRALPALLALVLACGCAQRDPGDGLHRITIATGPSGTAYNQIGTSLSTVLERELDVASTARPHTGSSLYIPQMHRGELPFGLNNSTDTAAAYRGELVYARPLDNLRAVMLVSRSPLQYFVRGDSGIQTMADLRGRPVVTSFRANVPFDIINAATLATAGLTLDDVDAVTVASVPDAIRALVEGRVAAASTLLGIPAFREANATVPGGLRILPLGPHEEALTQMPGFDAIEMQPGPATPGISVPTRVARMDVYLNSSVLIRAEDVYRVVSTIHRNWAALQQALPAFRTVAADEIAGSTWLTVLFRIYTFILLFGGLLWAMDVPSRLGLPLIEPEWLGPFLGVATAAAFLRWPYRRTAGALDAVLGFMAIGCWLWLAINYASWMFDIEGYTLGKFIPGALGIVLMMEGVRKSCGTSIAVLLVIMLVYALLGYLLPRPMQADTITPELLVMYLYSDTSAIPGQVLSIIASVVLAFVVFGKLMEVSGATQFFTDTAMALMGRRRGGPAKIAVAASGMMGSVTGSPVSNIMSTGVVTIPMMKRMGFTAEQSAAVEATASTGGVLAPPVMGATAFLMAEFLNVDYGAVALAAMLPAIFYFLCLYLQVDAMAARMGLSGLPKSALPRLGTALRTGWIFVLPMMLLVYLLFFEGFGAQYSAMGASVMLLGLALVRRRLRSRAEWSEFVFGSGSILIPLILVAGAAGMVVGIMSLTGLGQSLSVILVQIGADWGLLAMLALTAVLCIVLGLGMPTTAIYVVLAAIVAPALVEMGVTPMGAHMFILYFGVMSFLTPPVAVSAYVAAGIANADMWRTGWIGMRMSIMAALLPFLWAYDPALLMDGSWLSILIVCCTTLAAILLIARGVGEIRGTPGVVRASSLLLGLIVAAIGTSPVWLGHDSLLALLVAGAGVVLYALMPALYRRAEAVTANQ